MIIQHVTEVWHSAISVLISCASGQAALKRGYAMICTVHMRGAYVQCIRAVHMVNIFAVHMRGACMNICAAHILEGTHFLACFKGSPTLRAIP